MTHICNCWGRKWSIGSRETNMATKPGRTRSSLSLSYPRWDLRLVAAISLTVKTSQMTKLKLCTRKSITEHISQASVLKIGNFHFSRIQAHHWLGSPFVIHWQCQSVPPTTMTPWTVRPWTAQTSRFILGMDLVRSLDKNVEITSVLETKKPTWISFCKSSSKMTDGHSINSSSTEFSDSHP